MLNRYDREAVAIIGICPNPRRKFLWGRWLNTICARRLTATHYAKGECPECHRPI
jgi:hypothetical protein